MGQTSSGAIGSVKKNSSVVATVTNWTLNAPTAASSSIATSNSKGGVITTTGSKDTSGSFSTKGLIPVAFPGETLTFTGFCGPADGALCGTGEGVLYSVPVIISSISFAFDFNGSDALGWTYNFSGNGALTETVGTLSDASTPDIETIQGATISTGLNITAGNITISSAVSGGTATSNSQGWKLRWPGPISGTAQLTCVMHKISEIDIGIDDNVALTITTASGKVLTFKWWKITGTGAITVDNNSGELQPFTIDGAFSAHNGSAYGEISVDSTQIYPLN